MTQYRPLMVIATIVLAAFAAAGVLSGAGATAQEPDRPDAGTAVGTAFTYQGRLTDEGGAPLTGSYDFQFRLHDGSGEDAVQIGDTITVNDRQVEGGRFTVQLDFGADAFAGDARWLEVSVREGDSDGSYTPLSPRQALTPAPYALYAEQAPWSGISGVPTDLADGDDDTTYSAGAGLSLSGSAFSADFAGSGSATTVARSDHDHLGQTWTGSDNPLVLSGSFFFDAPLVLANADFFGDGLRVDSAGRNGVFVESADFNGVNVGFSGGDGVFVDLASFEGLEVGSAGGYGVYVNSAGWDGVRVDSAGFDGVHVSSADDDGIYVGNADADNDGSGVAGYFAGDVVVTGTINSGSTSSLIDHPQDPENMTLSHSFVGSPEMMNVYNGNVTTDGEGFATVTLPDYFEALNTDYRYQLTVIGDFAQAIVAEEIEGNQFVIQTDQPNVTVSWQVTGVRNDPYAQANPIAVEEEKPAHERGLYLHPGAYGLPPEMAIGYARGENR